MSNRRIIRRCLYGLACFASLILLFYAEEDWRGRRDWENYKRVWEAKGERFDFASFVPSPVPDDQNFALTPIVASTYSAFLDPQGHRINPPNTNVVNRLDFTLDIPSVVPGATDDFEGNWQVGMKADLNSFQSYYRAPKTTDDFPKAPEPQTPAADVLLALSKDDAAIEELRQATHLPHSRLPFYYDANLFRTTQFPDLSSLSQCALLLRIRAVAELENGQNEKALDDIKLILYLANSFRDQPFLTSYLISYVNLALQPLWEGLAGRKWSDSQLAFFEQELAQFDLLSIYQFDVRIRRARAIEEIDYMERWRGFNKVCAAFLSDPVEGEFDAGSGRGLEATVLYLMPKGWFYQNNLAIAQTVQQSLRTEDEAGHGVFPVEIAERYQKALSFTIQHLPPLNPFTILLYKSSTRLMQNYAFAQASLDLARVACALERFRLAHGDYPATLGLLSPQLIEKLPPDLIDGQPLRYRCTDGGQFLLYSVGWNGTDDGGRPVRKQSSWDSGLDLEKGDWVWPCRSWVHPISKP